MCLISSVLYIYICVSDMNTKVQDASNIHSRISHQNVLYFAHQITVHSRRKNRHTYISSHFTRRQSKGVFGARVRAFKLLISFFSPFLEPYISIWQCGRHYAFNVGMGGRLVRISLKRRHVLQFIKTLLYSFNTRC